ncbi:hypothetical protein DJ568_16015 [Mucilaginibacter hurinus]|uniref:Cupin n=1 Tax=Mucilaginibacter hurinus TaxID=2201324 RepID=A0A367GJU4_9SPHI|nr:hypothetical protein [Mucilaginibacter hurinus]RCH53744.1 hypothetical protein DJ568_16015 [Mucilaginibacter hurinus]
MTSFKVTRIYTDSEGESRFEDIFYPLHSQGIIGALSEKVNVQEMTFRAVEPAYDYDFHNAPARQFVVLPDGEVEIETSAGEKRIFGPGEVLQAEDIDGRGHRSRNVENKTRRSLFITYR